MEALYHAVYHEPNPVEYLRQNAPEIPTLVLFGVFTRNKRNIEALLRNIKLTLGSEAFDEFVNLHTDEQKFDLILEVPTARICLPTETVIKLVRLSNMRMLARRICNAVVCNNHKTFEFLLDVDQSPHAMLFRLFLAGLSENPSAVTWFDEIIGKTTNYDLVIYALTNSIIYYPNLIINGKYIIDRVLEVSGYSYEYLSRFLIRQARVSSSMAFAVCEVLNMTRYFDYEFFDNLAKDNDDIKLWLGLTSDV